VGNLHEIKQPALQLTVLLELGTRRSILTNRLHLTCSLKLLHSPLSTIHGKLETTGKIKMTSLIIKTILETED
jgi:hypothetical protein